MRTSVRAMFRCNSIEDFGDSVKAKFMASHGEGSEDFTPYTPSGSLEIQINKNTTAADFFKPQKDYFIDLA